MDGLVDGIAAAYDDLLKASVIVIEAKAQTNGQKSQLTDSALENYKDKAELFRVSCDRAEEFVESMKQIIGSQSLVDEATGISHPTVGPEDGSGSGSIPRISAVRLEQMSKAVRWLVIELQQHGGGGGGGGSDGSGGGGSAGTTQLQPERSPDV